MFFQRIPFYFFPMLFIHQYPDWTNFRFAKKTVLDKLCRVRFAQGELHGKSTLAISNSTAETIQQDDFEALLNIDGKDSPPPILFSAARNFSMPMSEKRLSSLHASLFQNGGCYRKSTNNKSTSFSGVSTERISREIQKWILYFNESTTDAVLKAAITHFWFLTIRPFDFGNGILARLLCDMLLSKSENSPIHCYALNREILQDRDSYFEILYKSQTSNGDITEWILWFLSKLETSLLNAEQNLQKQFVLAKRQLSFSGVAFHEREQALIDNFLKNPEKTISSSEWALNAGISHDSALRDLNDLVQKNILSKSTGRGRNTRYHLKNEKI